MRRVLKPHLGSAGKSAVLSEGFCQGRRRETDNSAGSWLSVAEECLMTRGSVQPMLTIAKIEYRTLFYVGRFLGGGGERV